MAWHEAWIHPDNLKRVTNTSAMAEVPEGAPYGGCVMFLSKGMLKEKDEEGRQRFIYSDQFVFRFHSPDKTKFEVTAANMEPILNAISRPVNAIEHTEPGQEYNHCGITGKEVPWEEEPEKTTVSYTLPETPDKGKETVGSDSLTGVSYSNPQIAYLVKAPNAEFVSVLKSKNIEPCAEVVSVSPDIKDLDALQSKLRDTAYFGMKRQETLRDFVASCGDRENLGVIATVVFTDAIPHEENGKKLFYLSEIGDDLATCRMEGLMMEFRVGNIKGNLRDKELKKMLERPEWNNQESYQLKPLLEANPKLQELRQVLIDELENPNLQKLEVDVRTGEVSISVNQSVYDGFDQSFSSIKESSDGELLETHWVDDNYYRDPRFRTAIGRDYGNLASKDAEAYYAYLIEEYTKDPMRERSRKDVDLYLSGDGTERRNFKRILKETPALAKLYDGLRTRNLRDATDIKINAVTGEVALEIAFLSNVQEARSSFKPGKARRQLIRITEDANHVLHMKGYVRTEDTLYLERASREEMLSGKRMLTDTEQQLAQRVGERLTCLSEYFEKKKEMVKPKVRLSPKKAIGRTEITR